MRDKTVLNFHGDDRRGRCVDLRGVVRLHHKQRRQERKIFSSKRSLPELGISEAPVFKPARG
jgi:hypothetical protein